MLIAHFVLFKVGVVRSAIEFDDEFGGGTGEIGEKAVDWVLAPELETRELVGTQQFPQRSFGGRLIAAQFAGAQGVGVHGNVFGRVDVSRCSWPPP